ncbi:hypothetical protein PR003_g9955 [Phytophthora rubi]|uniref:PH domain-containing protein n=1 Tax=Phytophthora rubi TaxID=129364 RepID=A0A6A4FGQ9_9STRA|nr:hypothetical protein PR001_g9564 [Phytophthora rubi]KAE9341505.1 hypothetical protein PR003_g9955 [Phytophthora rubi]
MLSLGSSGASSRRLTRQCTCAAETDSDSDNESDAGFRLADTGRTASAPPTFRGATNEDDDQDATGDDENGNGSTGSTDGASLDPFLPQTTWSKSLSLLELTKAVHDPLKASQALHNAEALRQAPALDNVFCSCYDVDTVLTTVQRRERGHFSPVQKLLLEPESIKQVFAYATSFSDEHNNEVGEEATDPNSLKPHPDKYRQSYVATEIILRFYLKAMAWYGEPKQDPAEENGLKSENVENPAETRQLAAIQDRNSGSEPSVNLEGLAVSASKAPTNMSTMMDFRSNASTQKMARIQRLRASMRFESSGSSISEFSVNGDEDEELLEDPATRGYLLRLEDLTATEWKRIFGGLFRFLWPLKMKNDGEIGDNRVVDDEVEIDSVLVANMCRITKNFVTFPAVHRLICDENDDSEGEWLLSRLAAHAYNPDIASLLHGLIHLSIRRGFEYFPIIRCLVERIVEQVPTRLTRSMSAVSSTSTVSSTSSASPRSSLGGSPPSASPSSFFSSKTAPLSPSLFTTNTTSTVHARISGCAEILIKILKDEFPNTFRYFIQTKIQLASFESVETFERELFPPRTAPSDPAMHHKLKRSVLAALVENATILARLAELGMAELRFLDAHHINGVCIPRVLVIDILRHAIEFCLHDFEQLEVFVAPIHLVLDTICASINYHQHLSTISEFAARDCFSDSDSDDDETEDGEDFDSVAGSSGKDSPSKPVKRPGAVPGRTALYMGITPPALSYSPRSGKAVINHRPLASTLLVMHVVELLDVVIRMSNDRIDSRLSRLDLATSLMDIFEKFPKASILHCRLVKLYLNLLNRPTTNGRVNNPLLRSVFRSPDSILEFILQKLHANSSSHIYDAHLAIIGVKIAKICSSPTLQQELIRQFCNNVKGWNDFASSLVATHCQQMDALDDSLLGLQVVTGGSRNGTPRKRNTSEDEVDADFPLARPSSSASEYLSRELEPFRRLPMEKEGFGSSSNLARGNEAVHPSDMFQSRSQSKFPESIIDILQSDESTPLDVEEDDFFVSGYVYQKRSKWAKVHLKFEKATCQLTLQDATAAACGSPSNGASKATSPSKASLLKQFLLAHKQTWTSRPKKLVVCNARKWIAFGQSLKKPNRGAFGFQVEVFDGHREEDETLTFVTRSEATRMQWFEAMQCAVARTRTARNSFSDIDEAANTELVQCVAKNRGGPYLVVPDVNLLGPMTSASFFIKSEVPEEMPFWGTYHGDQGIIKYVSLFKQCLDVVSVEEKNIQAIGYSVIVEFDATFRRSESVADFDDSEPPTVKCACTDTYLISGNQIIGLTRTIADSEKLLQLLCDDE